MNWSLALDFTKALAAPIAALVGVIVTATLAVRNFRRQKRIERQLDWYERTHRVIIRAKSCLSMIAAAVDENNHEHLVKAAGAHRAAQLELLESAAEAALYAHQGAFHQVWRMRKGLEALAEKWANMPPSMEQCSNYATLYQETSEHLAVEMRADIGLKALKRLNLNALYPGPESQRPDAV